MVSIVLVTYKRAQRLKLSIQDILNQSFKDFELIICDDCSPDETEAVCRDFASRDKRVRYYRHVSNLQMPGNLNFGIRHAKYEFVAILHDGDRFHPDLLLQWYNAISSNKSVGFVFNSIGDIDSNDNVVKRYKEFPEGIVSRELLLKSIYFRRPHFDSPVWGEAMIRKKLVEDYGYFKSEFGFYADVDVWMELLHQNDAYYCADMLISCPLKTIQPQLFKNDTIKFNMYLVSMHLNHRKKEFRSNVYELLKELTIFYAHALVHMCLCLLSVIKDASFKEYVSSRQHLGRIPILYVAWGIFLIFYPVLKPMLMAYQWAKQSPVSKKVVTTT